MAKMKRTPGPLTEFAAKKRREAAAPQLIEALKAMQKAYRQLMPGLTHIAVQDYANINDAPILAAKALKAAGEASDDTDR